ncbi:hypothetical protein [Marinicella litoralis]|uniref:DoxX-like protein n=1 Tax=Marinicella litoralis TaxID=644220 RepID=A0A4R6XYD1_9GAMM|nr:hypothetical protein [Marinicella litoralis]TDR23520.1 hypothetical protein C8D91_0383 [Marinicella litoralis]
MKIFYQVITVILMLLAVSSGISKIMLMEQDVMFFAPYGFSNALLMIFGVAQVIGGLLLMPFKTRVLGAIIVAITFVISLVMLLMAKSMLFAAVTLVSLLLLGMVVKERLSASS